jgi:hypothetical protein
MLTRPFQQAIIFSLEQKLSAVAVFKLTFTSAMYMRHLIRRMLFSSFDVRWGYFLNKTSSFYREKKNSNIIQNFEASNF